MKKIIYLVVLLYLLLFINSFVGKSIPVMSTTNNLNNILDNNPTFLNLLSQELNKKYPEYITKEVINNYKTYAIEETDLYVEMYSEILQNTLSVYIDCRDLDGFNLGCRIDDDYINKNAFNLDKNKKTIALTFDDGPSNNTKIITDLLAQNKANATFFVLGSKLDDISVENLKYALKTGNEIGSHTYSHKILTQLKETNLPDEFNKVNNIIKNKLNYEIKLVRPPYGIINNQIKSQYNYSYIIWDIDTLDWKLRSANKIYNKVVGEVNDGDIVLMHETYYSTYKALERILPALYSSGFQVTTVSNLAKLKGIDLKPNTVYYNFK